MPYIGHVQVNIVQGLCTRVYILRNSSILQIAQVPNRNEPNTDGELNYKYVFHALEQAGYNDWIGCEYRPKTSTVDGLRWIEEFGYSL